MTANGSSLGNTIRVYRTTQEGLIFKIGTTAYEGVPASSVMGLAAAKMK